ncbi:MAG: coenzyme synthesis protein [Francisellaceae bacterium]|nr:coenzyme synthesis protein [Francisellaceae bacterium]
MNFVNQLKESLNAKTLLNHPFYQLWSMGALDKNILAEYSKQYYKHVEAFPRYISAIHSLCPCFSSRQILLENLIEEEQGPENHPKLWRDFAQSLDVTEDAINNIEAFEQTNSLVNIFYTQTRISYARGLGCLYAYEQQTPAIAKTKKEGLIKFYGIKEEKGLKFFDLHADIDIWHTEQLELLLENLSKTEKSEAKLGAAMGAEALWNFLDGMMQFKQSMVH